MSCAGSCSAQSRSPPPGRSFPPSSAGMSSPPSRRPPPPLRVAPPYPPQHHEHHFVPGRDDLTDTMMEDYGDGGVWSEASAMSLTDFEQSGTEDDCPVCEESDPQFHSTMKRSAPASRRQQEGECAPGADSSSKQPRNDSLNISALASGPSKISVFDAEELNITTAPRNTDWDIPRNRIWQTLSNSLDETEKEEEDEYMDFVAGIQHHRREFFEGSM